ncbi:MAG: aminoacyl-tRNA hydrolase [Oscillospiraceae bacterium]|nr:aminoacyl-tRNA hydrolase [Oscillospiraceae bacterium]
MSIFDIFAKLKRQNDQKQESAGAPEFIIAGLGNPGKRYLNTRHNSGFLAVDAVAKRLDISVKKIKFQSLTAECTIAQKRCLLMKPSTYMNLSGQAVAEAMRFYKILIHNVIIIHDDAALPFGKIRIRKKGSDGGHNGLKNIIRLSGNNNFLRIKIGIGAPEHSGYDLAAWALSCMSADELEQIGDVMKNIDDILSLLVNGKTDEAMNKYN